MVTCPMHITIAARLAAGATLLAVVALATPTTAVAATLSLPKLGLTIEAEPDWTVKANPWPTMELVSLGGARMVIVQVDTESCVATDPTLRLPMACPQGFSCGLGKMASLDVMTLCTRVGAQTLWVASSQQTFDDPIGPAAVVVVARRTRDALVARSTHVDEPAKPTASDSSETGFGRLYLGILSLAPSDPQTDATYGARVGLEVARDASAWSELATLIGLGGAIGWDSAGNFLFDARVSAGLGFQLAGVQLGFLGTVGLDRIGPDTSSFEGFDIYAGGEVLLRIPIAVIELDGGLMWNTSETRWWAALGVRRGDLAGLALGVEMIHLTADAVEGEFATDMTSVFLAVTPN